LRLTISTFVQRQKYFIVITQPSSGSRGFRVQGLWGSTVDGDFSRPLGRSIQDDLLDVLHVLSVDLLGDAKHRPDLREDLRLVPLADLHAGLHGRDDVLRLILRATLGALLCCSWGKMKTT